MSGEMTLLANLYEAYNAQDVDYLLTLVSNDVDWRDGAGRLHGKDAVRRYWIEQSARIQTHAEPVEFRNLGHGVVQIRVEQIVRDLAGDTISEGAFQHRYRLHGSSITHMDLQPRE